MIRKSFSVIAGLCLLGFAFAGCATKPSQSTGMTVPAVPEKDKVLWQYRSGLAALRQGNYSEAKGQLDAAIARISNIMGKDEAARKARGYFHAESKKTFIGEPYERVMAYYYRGILYWMDGEPDNARACFRSAMLLDSDAENNTFKADYSLLEYLDGYAAVKMSGDGSEPLARAGKLAHASLPDYNPRANVLLFVETGNGPQKYAGGEYNEVLLFSQGKPAARSAVLKVNGQTVEAPAYDDLYFQATTRGGRVMDQILANK